LEHHGGEYSALDGFSKPLLKNNERALKVWAAAPGGPLAAAGQAKNGRCFSGLR
jgi:hypothetical protein